MGDIGLVEYNPETAIWECRFEHCRREMITDRLKYYRRAELHPSHSPGESTQEIARPYFSKTYIAKDKLLMRVELAPHQGNRNMEIRPHLQTEDAPRGKRTRTPLKMKGTVPELRLQRKKLPCQYQPITRLKLKDRPQQQDEDENGDAEIRHENSRPSRTHERANTLAAAR